MRKRQVFYIIKKRRRKLLIGITIGTGIALLIAGAFIIFLPKQNKPETIFTKPEFSIASSKPQESKGEASSAPLSSSAVISSSPETETAPPKKSPLTCAKESAGINKDVVGWIRLEGTSVDYPVTQAKDNAYYLTRDAGKEKSKKGAIFLDYRCNPVSLKGNNILYGHHMKDGSMFAALVQYKEEDFFKQHTTFEFATLKKTYQWEIFSVFITDTNYDYIQTEFINKEQYHIFIKTMQKKSLFKTNISLRDSDDILLLSTCTYEYDDARFVVAARRKK